LFKKNKNMGGKFLKIRVLEGAFFPKENKDRPLGR